MILFLNGCSSSGKSTVARALQHLYTQPLLLIGIDTFFHMMPPEYVHFGDKADQGFHFIPAHDELGALMRIESGPFGEAIVSVAPMVINLLADNGFDLIVDEVVFGEEGLKEYAQTLKNHSVYLIGVKCDLPVLQEREALRGNRALGLGRDQIDRVHVMERFYDFTVDTTSTSPSDCAKTILKFVKETPDPQGFKRILGKISKKLS